MAGVKGEYLEAAFDAVKKEYGSLADYIRNQLGSGLFGGEGLFNTVLTGPGRVLLQTMPISSVAGAILPYIPTAKNGSRKNNGMKPRLHAISSFIRTPPDGIFVSFFPRDPREFVVRCFRAETQHHMKAASAAVMPMG